MKITSVNNDLIKEISKLSQRKYRDEKGLFLLEGEKCISEALDSGIQIEYLFVEESYNRFKDQKTIETTSAVLSKISTTDTPPKCVAVGRQLKREWNNNFKKLILLENIKDAGNLGTILRTACAFDIDAIILYGDTVDLYNPKCVRASVGNLWKIPVFCIKTYDNLMKMSPDYTPIATLPKSDNSIWLKDYIFPEKFILMFGTESEGLSSELKNYAKESGTALTIEMSGKVESLNLSTSAGVILYKIFAD